MRVAIKRLVPHVSTGTRSLLYGVHAFWWHPWTVARAWHTLYGTWPSWREWVCILVHDWGYARCAQMDDERGKLHPLVGASIVGRLFGAKYRDLVLYHSRHLARRLDRRPSALCWADKLSLLYDPPRFYLWRARLSEEIAEYRAVADATGFLPLTATDEEFVTFLRGRFLRLAFSQQPDVVTSHTPAP